MCRGRDTGNVSPRWFIGRDRSSEECYLGEHEPIIDQPLWDAVQAQVASNAVQRNDDGKRAIKSPRWHAV
jgi:hypothetical protein